MRRFISVSATVGIVTAGALLGSLPHAAGHAGHSVTVNDASGNEGTATPTVTFTLTLSPAPQQDETVSVQVATANNTATGGSSCSIPGTDYVSISSAPQPTRVSFAAGETTKTIAVPICQDSAIEGSESFFLNLSDPAPPSTLTISRFQGVGTIVDDEAAPSLSIDNRSAAEGDSGTTAFAFPVTLSAASNGTVTARYKTVDGTASAPSDYQAQTNGLLTFSPGQTTQNITVAVVGETAGERDETFFVNLSSPTNATITNPQGIGMIQNDDTIPAGASTLTVTDVSVNEGHTGLSPATPFTFTVTLSQPPSAGNTISVNYSTSDGTATVGSDYVGQSGSLQFTNSETAETVRINVSGDTAVEPNETFFLNLSSPACTITPTCTPPTITDAQGTGTIVDDDAAPTPSPSGSPAPITAKMKVGGYFQVRVTAASPCQAGRLVKVKQSVPGTDKVRAQGTTDGTGVFKKKVRPRKSGRFYSQSYSVTVQGVVCKGAKSPIRTLPA